MGLVHVARLRSYPSEAKVSADVTCHIGEKPRRGGESHDVKHVKTVIFVEVPVEWLEF